MLGVRQLITMGCRLIQFYSSLIMIGIVREITSIMKDIEKHNKGISKKSNVQIRSIIYSSLLLR